jgi:predicted dehydrogenase
MIKLAVVGTGGMANAQANAFKAMKGVKLVAACDIINAKAQEFAAKYGISKVFSNVTEMLDSVDIDAVTVVTPDSSHADVSLKVLARGKHILCEKPLATCYKDAQSMADAASKAGAINMVNLSYRRSAAIQKAHQLVSSGALGRIMHVEASYLQSWLSSKVWGNWQTSPSSLWRLSTQHGSGGVLGDIGVHILDFTTFAAGDVKSVNCKLKTFHKADGDRIGEYFLDANDSAVITVEFVGGAVGTIHTTRWATGHANTLRLRVFGDKGALLVDLDQSYDSYQICQGEDIDKVAWKTISLDSTPDNYQRFINSIRTKVNDQPDFTRGAIVQKMLDACFESDREGKAVQI